jgi:hypothetical protein
MTGYNEGTERSTTDRPLHITVQHFLLDSPPIRFLTNFNCKRSVINVASDKRLGLVDVGQRRPGKEYSRTTWEALTEILPFINRTYPPGYDRLREKNRKKTLETHRLRNRDQLKGLYLHLA